MDKLMDKVVTLGVSMAGGFVASKVFEIGWKQVTGEDAPKDDEIDSVSIKKALVFAVTSAAISSVVQVLSQRGAKQATAKLRASYGKQSEV